MPNSTSQPTTSLALSLSTSCTSKATQEALKSRKNCSSACSPSAVASTSCTALRCTRGLASQIAPTVSAPTPPLASRSILFSSVFQCRSCNASEQSSFSTTWYER
eukprot:CAMPEP_0173314376 /NCGR_PEP_ID=MMETSP1143-20121109/25296_1 /TAXON_ID=483371 /ORGANISM="non described non described, Strain CCMP2298" /LENGTH=104 /DNA_ID=CAMNT_0014256961 /DNA_START=377 /DNA_END=691 /DNA_ORIENTATION=+